MAITTKVTPVLSSDAVAARPANTIPAADAVVVVGVRKDLVTLYNNQIATYGLAKVLGTFRVGAIREERMDSTNVRKFSVVVEEDAPETKAGMRKFKYVLLINCDQNGRRSYREVGYRFVGCKDGQDLWVKIDHYGKKLLGQWCEQSDSWTNIISPRAAVAFGIVHVIRPSVTLR